MVEIINLIFEETNIRIEEVNSFLNILCGIESDSIINTNFTFGIISENYKLKFYIIVDENFENILKRKLLSIYPTIKFEKINLESIYKNKIKNDNSLFYKIIPRFDNNKKFQSLNQEKIFTNNLINALYNKENFISIVEINIQPIYIKLEKNKEIKEKKINKMLLNGLSFVLDCFLYEDITKVDNQTKNNHKINNKIEEQIIQNNCKISIHVGVINKNPKESIIKLKNIISVFSQLNYQNIFDNQKIEVDEMFNRKKFEFKLTTNELSQIICLPSKNMIDNLMGDNGIKNLIDRNIPNKGIIFGLRKDNEYVAMSAPLKISPLNYKKDYILNQKLIENIVKCKLTLGLPGTGKSEWIVNYGIECIKHGIPIIVIDPKNDTQKRLIESLPEEYMNNVDYLDLGDLLYPPALNIFRRRKYNDATENALLTSNFINYMKKQFDRSWGYNLQQMIQMTTDAILLDNISTMTEFYWMLTEPIYRNIIISIIKSKLDEPNCQNRSRLRQLLKYWNDFESRFQKNPMTVNKEIEPVMNKIGVFIGNRFINAIVSQRESYDFRNSGDNGKSVIINIPEGIINLENMSLLCGFISKSIWMDYQSRDDLELDERFPVVWIVDEAQTVIDDDFVGIMQKARSRRLGLHLAGQNLSSLNTKGIRMGDIILDNCKSKMIFRVGYQDAKIIADEFSPLTAKDLSECPDYNFYSKIILKDGTISKPFFTKALPMYPQIRNYDEFRKKHRSGKSTINEIEDDIDNRFNSFIVMNELTKY